MNNSTEPSPTLELIENLPFIPVYLALILTFAILLIIQVVVMVYVILNRDYLPFKSKQVDLLTMAVFFSCVWYPGFLQSIKIIPHEGVWSLCSLWQVWFNIVFGFSMWASLVILRFWKLVFLFKLKKKAANWKMNCFFFIIWTPSLAYGIAAVIVEPFDTVNNYCVMDNSFLYALYAYIGILFILFFVFMFVLRNINHSAFNEFAENRRNALFATVCFIAFVVIVALNELFYDWARITCLVLIQSLINFKFWNILGYNLFKTIQDKEGFERSFKEQMSKDSMAAVTKKAKSMSQSLDPLKP